MRRCFSIKSRHEETAEARKGGMPGPASFREMASAAPVIVKYSYVSIAIAIAMELH